MSETIAPSNLVQCRGKLSYPTRQTANAARNRGKRFEWLVSNAQYSRDECLLWPFWCQAEGYGSTKLDGRTTPAHRAMAIIALGPPPMAGMHAAHSCNNRACCNPKHLRWATPSENQRDREKHGTRMARERHPRAKLSPSDVQQIRDLRGAVRQTDLAHRFGVVRSTIQSIQYGKLWK